MTEHDIREVVLSELRRIAPEIDPGSLDPGELLRDQVDLDSVDFANLLIAIADRLGVDVPEADYPQVASLDGCVEYLARHGAAGAG